MRRKLLLAGLLFCLGVFPVCAQVSDIQHQNPKVESAQSIDKLYGNYDNQVKIIFSDIDGTILGFNKKCPKQPIPQEVKKSVTNLQEQKIPFVLVTGRVYEEAKALADEMGVKNNYIVGLQGAEIVDPNGKLIYTDPINKKDVEKIFKGLKSFQKSHKMHFHNYLFVDGKVYSTENVKLPYNWAEIHVIKSLKDFDKNYSCCKFLICETNPQNLKLIKNYLKKNFPNYDVNICTDCYCELANPTATKGSVVKKLSQIYGIDLKNVAVFGDSENDLSMFKVVKDAGGVGIATGNAMPVLKQNSNYITLDVWDCGFSKGVDEIIKNNKRLDKKLKK